MFLQHWYSMQEFFSFLPLGNAVCFCRSGTCCNSKLVDRSITSTPIDRRHKGKHNKIGATSTDHWVIWITLMSGGLFQLWKVCKQKNQSSNLFYLQGQTTIFRISGQIQMDDTDPERQWKSFSVKNISSDTAPEGYCVDNCPLFATVGTRLILFYGHLGEF